MAQKVLVVYGSKYGGTAEIAEEIGKVLKQENLEVDVFSADHAGNPAKYDAFVIGSGVYAGMWRKEAVSFVINNVQLIGDKPVWIFSSGPVQEGDPIELSKEWRYPAKIRQQIDQIKPQDITIFHGIIDAGKINFFEKLIMRMVGGKPGDLRDWEMIASWAKNIAAELNK